MFREMRRKNQALAPELCREVLDRNTHGVLALAGDGGYPYAVPLNYLYEDGRIYFHCAKEGHKIDAVKASAKASFCVVDADDVIPDEFTTNFRSVIAFGRVRLLEDPEEIRAVMFRLAQRYSPGRDEGIHRTVREEMPELAILELSVEHMTGKESRRLMQARNAGGRG